jgi:hypothetical protein
MENNQSPVTTQRRYVQAPPIQVYRPNPLYDGKPKRRQADFLNPFQRRLLLVMLCLSCLILLKIKDKKPESDAYYKAEWLDSPIQPIAYNTEPIVKRRSLLEDLETVKTKVSRIVAESDRLQKAAAQRPNASRNPRVSRQISVLDTSTNLVFAGSFENKKNAVVMLNKLKNMGYKKAEIIMKEGLPYLVVVADYYAKQVHARTDARQLERKGIDTYVGNKNWEDIYRKK